jgi:hypothetical protein
VHQTEGFEIFEQAFLVAVSPYIKPLEFAFRSKGWVIKISDSLLKTGIMTALLSGILYLADYNMLPALILPSIIPLLFDIEQVRLQKSEEEILYQLTLHKQVRKSLHSPKKLYKLLPTAIQEELSELDFIDFIEKLKQAGLADEKGNKVKIYPKEKGKWRIRFI